MQSIDSIGIMQCLQQTHPIKDEVAGLAWANVGRAISDVKGLGTPAVYLTVPLPTRGPRVTESEYIPFVGLPLEGIGGSDGSFRAVVPVED